MKGVVSDCKDRILAVLDYYTPKIYDDICAEAQITLNQAKVHITQLRTAGDVEAMTTSRTRDGAPRSVQGFRLALHKHNSIKLAGWTRPYGQEIDAMTRDCT